MLWLKAFHIVFVVTWFAGLFYLPRLFVYHVGTEEPQGRARFEVMERKLFVIMSIGAVLAALFGLALLHGRAALLSQGWLQVKLVLVAGLVVYHLWCGALVRAFSENRNKHSELWYRWFNEVPAIALLAIVILAVVRPF